LLPLLLVIDATYLIVYRAESKIILLQIVCNSAFYFFEYYVFFINPSHKYDYKYFEIVYLLILKIIAVRYVKDEEPNDPLKGYLFDNNISWLILLLGWSKIRKLISIEWVRLLLVPGILIVGLLIISGCVVMFNGKCANLCKWFTIVTLSVLALTVPLCLGGFLEKG
jgi:hypothetical protein